MKRETNNSPKVPGGASRTGNQGQVSGREPKPPKGGTPNTPNKGGRPTAYRAEYANIAFGLCLAGYTDQELADSFGVSKSTLELWKLKHPKFSDSIRRGKDPANSKVSVSLYEMATGYERSEQVLTKDADGNPQIETLKVFYPPSPRAAEFFLRNRVSHKFRDVQRVAPTDAAGNDLAQTATVEELKMDLARSGLLDARGRFVTAKN